VTAAQLLSHLRALPEMILLAGTCALMIVDLMSRDGRRRATFWGAQAVLLLCLLATLFVISESEQKTYYIFYGLFVSDLLGHVLKVFAYVSVSVAL